MIVAVTGGSGFIGKRLVEHHLSEGDVVRVLSRNSANKDLFSSKIELFEGDLSNAETDLSPFLTKVDLLYNCAGEIRDKDVMHNLHVSGTKRLSEAAAGEICHWVQLSSAAVYGPVFAGNISEEYPLEPVGVYGTTKALAESLVIEAASRHGFTYSIVRPSNVFGSDMYNGSLFGVIAAVEKGYFFFIGKPGAKANYIHIEDVVQGLSLCGVSPEARNQVYNISSQISMEKYISLIAAALDKNAPKLRFPESAVRAAVALFGSIPGFPLTRTRIDALTSHAAYDCSKIEKELGYRQGISMEVGLKQLVEFWRRMH